MRFFVPFIFSATVLAQTPKPEFDVASIRLAENDDSHRFSVDNNRLLTHNITLKILVARAFDLAPEQVFGGPDWTAQQGFDIRAKIPEGLPEKERHGMFSSMLQSLLTDRFHATFHREVRQVSGYTLSVNKGGSKLEVAKPDQKDNSMNSSRFQLTAANVDIEDIAKFLGSRLEAPVVDKTDLKGKFNFKLRWSPDALAIKGDLPADAPPALPTALQEQLGLKLDSGKVSVPVVVIDTAQKPNAN